jgi:hypothetical protein
MRGLPQLTATTLTVHAGTSFLAREAGVSIKPGAQAPGNIEKRMRAREAGDSLLMVCRPLRGLIVLYIYVPGACAPGFMPTPASQAKKLSAHTQFTCHHSQLCYTPRMPTKKQTKLTPHHARKLRLSRQLGLGQKGQRQNSPHRQSITSPVEGSLASASDVSWNNSH